MLSIMTICNITMHINIIIIDNMLHVARLLITSLKQSAIL